MLCNGDVHGKYRYHDYCELPIGTFRRTMCVTVAIFTLIGPYSAVVTRTKTSHQLPELCGARDRPVILHTNWNISLLFAP